MVMFGEGDEQRHVRIWSSPEARHVVVLLPGWGEHAGLYDRLAGEMNERGVTVLALDYSGHGASGGDRGVIADLDAWQRDVEHVVAMAEAEGQPITLVGQDIGALVGALVAADGPGRFRSLVVAGGRVTSSSLSKVARHFPHDALAGYRDEVDHCSTDHWYVDRLRDDPLVWDGGFSLETLATVEDGWSRLSASMARIVLPVLVVHGGLDSLVTPIANEVWATQLPDATFHLVPQDRHAVLNDRSRQAVVSTVVDFIDAADGQRRPAPAARLGGQSRGIPPESGRRPDIVLIMTDQQRFDWIGATSGGHFETPVIDGLASGGVLFEQAYSAATTCVPARIALLTGLHHIHTRKREGGRALQPGFWTVARELRAAGYETAMIGRMHFEPVHADHGFETMRMCENINPGSGYDESEGDDYRAWLANEGRPDWRLFDPAPDGGLQSFDPTRPRVFPEAAELHSTGWIEREAVSFLRNRTDERPLFLVVSFPHPHAPYDPPEPYASMYSPHDVRLPEGRFEVNDFLTGSFRAAFEEPFVMPVDDYGGSEMLRLVLASIQGMVRHIDDAVGRVVEALDLPSTLLFFTSDHGDYGGHRGLFAKSPWIPFDDLIRVPMVVAGGAVGGPARRSSLPVQSASFAPTCLDYAGIEVPPAMFDFPSLRPYLEGQEDSIDPETPLVAFSFPMVRRGRWKLITTGSFEEPLLFDLHEDPGETRSFAGEPGRQALVRDLIALLRVERAKPERDWQHGRSLAGAFAP